ncbi:glucokinase [Shewanella submarina]|uniref:Glucokinase n=1 Tax=Shewanella submarina TaxID=2016376 RepID=A0ABV7GER5_9GAMM|nr:glucokinase [Shewanella submarina]MCL1035682.1 glucokinase [Shewanella submarina]
MEQNQFVLVGDVGGTNGRFALVQRDGQRFCLTHQHTLPSANAGSLLELIRQYQALLPEDTKVVGGSIAVAGPVSSTGANLTNLGWRVVTAELKAELGLKHLCLLNDFAAYANSLPLLAAAEIVRIKPGKADKSTPVLVLGPGTGFGISSLHPQAGGFKPVACEGGHMALAPINELQDALVRQLRTMDEFVSVETILCGPGLVNLYRALAAVKGEATEFETAAEISSAAMDGSNALAVETLSLFCRWLGQTVGDLVMAHGALGGVVLGGGILPRMLDFLKESEFVDGMLDKGRMSDYLKDVPVQLAMKSDTALTGAAAWYYQSNMFS